MHLGLQHISVNLNCVNGSLFIHLMFYYRANLNSNIVVLEMGADQTVCVSRFLLGPTEKLLWPGWHTVFVCIDCKPAGRKTLAQMLSLWSSWVLAIKQPIIGESSKFMCNFKCSSLATCLKPRPRTPVGPYFNPPPPPPNELFTARWRHPLPAISGANFWRERSAPSDVFCRPWCSRVSGRFLFSLLSATMTWDTC